jgi:16S rRNA (guanine966-N2)-methyltransferase
VGRIRIISGELGGRRIRVPSGDEVRPTSDRVREALFSIISGRIPGARILDAYSGSGAMGFEALSRGGSEVVFVESSAEVLTVLKENMESLGLSGRCTIFHAEVALFLEGKPPERPFDVVLADPPYAAGEAARFLPAVSAPEWTSRDGLIVLERDRREAAVEVAGHGLALARTARYGSTCLDIYHR